MDRRILPILAASAALWAAATAIGLETLAVTRCHRGNAGEGRYLAHCTGGTVGDYEHAALWWRLEPGMAEALDRAQVLFLGTSRAMFGFSSTTLAEHFRAAGTPHYLVGFGHSERATFARALIERQGLRPKVLVINTDPFFDTHVSEPGGELLAGKWSATLRARFKRLAIGLAEGLCGRLPRLCLPRDKAIWRSVADGRWLWVGSFHPGTGAPSAPSARSAQEPDAKMVEEAVAAGEAFLRAMPVERSCVVLTGVPMPGLDTAALAEAVARRLGTAAVTAAVDAPATIDGNHIDAPTAERWTAALLPRLDPIIARCLR